jgi:hypothetical protein
MRNRRRGAFLSTTEPIEAHILLHSLHEECMSGPIAPFMAVGPARIDYRRNVASLRTSAFDGLRCIVK